MTLRERIEAATCTHHGFSSDDEREAHITAIVKLVLKVKS